MTPSADAIAGDYVVDVQGRPDLANADADIRVTIETVAPVGRDRARR